MSQHVVLRRYSHERNLELAGTSDKRLFSIRGARQCFPYPDTHTILNLGDLEKEMTVEQACFTSSDLSVGRTIGFSLRKWIILRRRGM
jgi:hypothetical protein